MNSGSIEMGGGTLVQRLGVARAGSAVAPEVKADIITHKMQWEKKNVYVSGQLQPA
jgi:hypothetical protein